MQPVNRAISETLIGGNGPGGICALSEHSHIVRLQLGCEIDEAASVCHTLAPFLAVWLAHIRRTAHTCDLEVVRCNLSLCILNAFGRKDGMRWQVEIALKSAELNCREPILYGEIENLAEIPCGTANG